MAAISDSYETLSAMIAPALFMTANGSLIISTSNRMARVVDRVRSVAQAHDAIARGESDVDFGAERMEHFRQQLVSLGWRNDRIRHALVLLYFAFGTFAGTSLALALDVLLAHRIGALPPVLASIGVSSMLLAAVNLLREALTALRTYRVESDFFLALHARRQAIRPGPDGG